MIPHNNFDYTETQKDVLAMKEAALRHEVIDQYLQGKFSIKEVKDRLGCSKSTLYRLIAKFDASNGPRTMLRDPRGRTAGQTLLQEEVEHAITKAIAKKFKGPASSYSKIWREVRDDCITSGLPVPSLGTVASRIKSMSQKEMYSLKYGSAAAYDKYGVKRGKLKLSRPLEVTQMDHTLVDVILCDEVNRAPLGRPWITILIDVKTRVILAYYLAWHSPSRVSVASTLAYCVSDKSNYLKTIGCEDLKYPFSGKPEAIHVDNAKEFKSASMIKGCYKNKIKLEWRKRKHYGGHIERLIGTLMTNEVHFLPGTTLSNQLQRKGINSEGKSAMTFKELNAWFARQVTIYHAEVHSSINMSPGDAWFKYFGVNSLRGLTARQAEDFKIDFLPAEKRKIGTKGILLKRNYYYSPDLLPHIGKSVTVKFDPFSIRKIWVELNGSNMHIPFSDITQDDALLEQEKICRIFESKIKDSKWISTEERIRIKNEAQKIVNKSQSEKKRARRKSEAAAKHREFDESLFPDGNYQEKVETSHKINYLEKPIPFSSD